MSADSMRVGHLQVRSRAPLASSVGLSARIQDALRTSSKPSSWHGRVILVRQLRVRLREHAPAHQMTIAFEREWQRLARSAVEYTHASPASEAVWFASQIDARLAVIAQLVSEADVSAWYWRRVLPLEAGASRDEQLLALFAAPWADLRVTDAEQMRVARQAFAALGSRARAAHIVAALTETELRRLLPLISHARGPVEEGRRMTSAPEALCSGPDPTHAFTAHESSRSQALRIAFTAIDADQSAGHELVVSKGDANGGVASQRREISDGVTSQWAGLFFVLNLLERAGDPPPADETVAILQAVATWLRIRPDEPIHDALAALNDESSRPTVPPARIRALRLACLMMTRRPLRRILSRAGRVVITRTHMTIVCALESVRLDVRKAGLDLDPGWLPRLGRVVRFAYE